MNEKNIILMGITTSFLDEAIGKISSFSSAVGKDRINVFKEIVCLVCRSMLSGEYVKSGYLEKIADIREGITFNNQESPSEVDNEISEILGAIYNSLGRFVYQIGERTEFIDRRKYINLYTKYKPTKSRNFQPELNTFNIIIRLCSIDHFGQATEKNISKLREISHSIDNAYGHLVINDILLYPIKDKAIFLMNKQILRFKRENPDMTLMFHQKKEPQELLLSETKNSFFEEQHDYILDHYELRSDYKKNIAQKVVGQNLDSKKLEELKFKDIHLLIKYYKDITSDLDKIYEIFQFLKRKGLHEYNTLTDLDAYSSKICTSYALNNWFSLFVEKNKQDVQTSYEKYKETIAYHESIGLKNYFPQYKFITTFFCDASTVKDYIPIAKKIIADYDPKSSWIKKNQNLLFQLPSNECLFATTLHSQDFFIYVHSSFVLPNSVKTSHMDVEQTVENLKRDIYYIEKQAIIEKRIIYTQEAQNKIHLKLEEIKKEEKRTIQILVIFSALISFIVGATNQAGVSPKSFSEALLFMLALSTSLSLFIVLIFRFLSPNKYKQFTLPYTIAVLVFWISFYLIYTIQNQ